MTDRDLRGPQALRPEELGNGDDRELRRAMDAGQALGASIDDVPVRVADDFTTRVMAAIANEPVPGRVGFMTPLRRRGLLAGFGESVRQAWAAIGSPGIPSFARATALAYVLVVAIAGVAMAGATVVGVGSAFGGSDRTTRRPAPTGTPSLTTSPTEAPLSTPGPQTAPVETGEPGESDDHSGPDASDDHAGASGEPSDDHGGNSGPGSSGVDLESDDHSGSGSGSGSTPRPSDTPRPSGTPKPSETPH